MESDIGIPVGHLVSDYVIQRSLGDVSVPPLNHEGPAHEYKTDPFMLQVTSHLLKIS